LNVEHEREGKVGVERGKRIGRTFVVRLGATELVDVCGSGVVRACHAQDISV
jgi:hypothetical protein